MGGVAGGDPSGNAAGRGPDGEDLETASWCKGALFDRSLGFDTGLVGTEGSLH